MIGTERGARINEDGNGARVARSRWNEAMGAGFREVVCVRLGDEPEAVQSGGDGADGLAVSVGVRRESAGKVSVADALRMIGRYWMEWGAALAARLVRRIRG